MITDLFAEFWKKSMFLTTLQQESTHASMKNNYFTESVEVAVCRQDRTCKNYTQVTPSLHPSLCDIPLTLCSEVTEEQHCAWNRDGVTCVVFACHLNCLDSAINISTPVYCFSFFWHNHASLHSSTCFECVFTLVYTRWQMQLIWQSSLPFLCTHACLFSGEKILMMPHWPVLDAFYIAEIDIEHCNCPKLVIHRMETLMVHNLDYFDTLMVSL